MDKIRYFLIAFFCAGFTFVNGQIAPETYWVQFADKNNTPYSLDKPEEFLSQRAISRRQRQGIKLEEEDLPVNPEYVDSLKKMGLSVHNVSKWFNGAVVKTTDTLLLDTLHNLTFVRSPIQYGNKITGLKNVSDKFHRFEEPATEYAKSENQVKMLNGHALHTENFRGKGMLIAVQDAGFRDVPVLECFEHLWDNDQIVDWRDFVKDTNDIFDAHSHGTLVFSIIAGIIPGEIYGVATEADFVLVRTEAGGSEYLVEEYNWVSGAEYCDSMGVDVMNSSLGYAEFDDFNQNHTYSEMDGKTTPISRGALIAAKKGMLVVTSAGNSGDDLWLHITAPADADSILTIGAVAPDKSIAGFSSRGPSSDGRVKPDVSAQGVSTVGQTRNGSLSNCNGTSCSSPLIAGMSACLWQSNPMATAQEIREAIIKASDRYMWPDSLYGYGIPDFILAKRILELKTLEDSSVATMILTPNPVREYALLSSVLPWLSKNVEGEINIYDLNGRMISGSVRNFEPGVNVHALHDISKLEPGSYFIRTAIDGRFYKLPFIKLRP